MEMTGEEYRTQCGRIPKLQDYTGRCRCRSWRRMHHPKSARTGSPRPKEGVNRKALLNGWTEIGLRKRYSLTWWMMVREAPMSKELGSPLFKRHVQPKCDRVGALLLFASFP